VVSWHTSARRGGMVQRGQLLIHAAVTHLSREQPDVRDADPRLLAPTLRTD